MDLNSLTGTSVALILLYLQLALGVSAATELISTVLDFRAKDLNTWLKAQLTADQLARLLAHPLIHAQTDKDGKRSAPARISPKVLEVALKEVLANQGTADPADKPTAEDTKKTADLEKLLEADHLQTWFNEGMERVGATYARWARKTNLVLALAAAVLLNADTFRIVKELPGSEAARAAGTEALAHIAATGLPTTPVGADPDLARRVEVAAADVREQLQRVQQNQLLGWPACTTPETQTCVFEANVGASAEGWVMRFLGLLTTALATSLGAPFWFDLLKKFVGAPAAETPKK